MGHAAAGLDDLTAFLARLTALLLRCPVRAPTPSTELWAPALRPSEARRP